MCKMIQLRDTSAHFGSVHGACSEDVRLRGIGIAFSNHTPPSSDKPLINHLNSGSKVTTSGTRKRLLPLSRQPGVRSVISSAAPLRAGGLGRAGSEPFRPPPAWKGLILRCDLSQTRRSCCRSRESGGRGASARRARGRCAPGRARGPPGLQPGRDG